MYFMPDDGSKRVETCSSSLKIQGDKPPFHVCLHEVVPNPPLFNVVFLKPRANIEFLKNSKLLCLVFINPSKY
jgi:hypothetical protein